LAPATTILAAITFLPFVVLIMMSLLEMNLSIPGSGSRFVGLDHYRELVSDSGFMASAVLSGRITVLGLLIEGPLGVLLGLYLRSLAPRYQRLLSGLLLIPMAMPPVIVGLTWLFLLQPDYGLVSALLRNAFGLSQPLLASPHLALTVVRLVDVWEWTPFVALITLAALHAIPPDVIHAARLDGLVASQRLRYVYWPALQRVVLLALLLRAIDALKVFEAVYILTGGGPGGATELASLYVHRISIRETQFGYGAAATVMINYVILALTTLFYRVGRRARGSA
jgi:ABC-type sugar transport system permease subunit